MFSSRCGLCTSAGTTDGTLLPAVDVLECSSPYLEVFSEGPVAGATAVSGVQHRGVLHSQSLFFFCHTALAPVSDTSFVVGIDAGASKTHLLAEGPDDSDRIELHGEGANPQRIGLDGAADVLAGLVREALQPLRSVETIAVSAGVAGAGRDDEQRALTERLHAALDRAASTVQVQIVHDGMIALDAAFGAESGLVVIAGTGSVVLGRTTDGSLVRAGGWGYLLGDVGSGYAVGRAGLRAVAEAFDGGPPTVLSEQIREHLGIEGREDLIQHVYQEEVSIPDMAPLVITAAAEGDDVASRILARQASELAKHVGWLLERGEDIAPRAAILGGLVQNDHYAQVLQGELREQLSGWSVDTLHCEPVVGALRRARRLLG